MDDNVKWHGEMLGIKAVESLRANNFQAVYAADRQAALDYILNEVAAGATVGAGGSMTVKKMGILPLLAAKGCMVYDHNAPGLSAAEAMDIRHREMLADVFITSTNALTLDGRLVNTDGAGNRVAAMIFGPKKVLVVAGINKLVTDEDEARKRIAAVAAPINAKRLHKRTPCAVTGVCADCAAPERICCVTSIINKKPLTGEFHVIVVNEVLGY